MKRLILIAVTAAIASTGLAGTQAERFIIETHTVSLPQSDQPQTITFKLDTTSGDVWQFTGTNFLQVPVEGTLSAGVSESTEPDTKDERERMAVLEKMKEITIPEMNFRQASLHDVIEFLQKASQAYDPDKQGVNLIVNIGSPSDPKIQTPDIEDPFAMSGDEFGHSDPILITFSARDISLYESIRIVTQVAGLKFRIEGDVVMIVPLVGFSDPATRLYELLPSTLERIQNYRPELTETNLPPATLSKRWEKFFSDFGVTWDADSAITPLPLIGHVAVRGYGDQLVAFEQVLTAINRYPPRPGRFRLVPPQSISSKDLMLFDSETGNTWKYERTKVERGDQTTLGYSFKYIPSRSAVRSQTELMYWPAGEFIE